MSFFANLEKELKKRGLVRADIVRGTGINESSIRSWWRGVVPSVDNAYKVACFLGVPLESLLIEQTQDQEEKRLNITIDIKEAELLNKFRNLSPISKDLVVNFSELLINQEKQQAFIKNLNNNDV